MVKIKWFAFGFLVLCCCCCDEAAAVYKSKTKKGTLFWSPTAEVISDTSIVDQHHDVGMPSGDLTLLEPPPSPECWKSAIAVFQKVQQTHFADDATRLCQVLPEEQQKLLALEIAKCHLQDLGKPLIQDRNILSECTVHARDKKSEQQQQEEDDKNKLQKCLKHLTDAGVNAYTHYVSYIQILCTRLTQELIASHQQETHKEMALRYADISTHSIEQMESIREIAQKHAEHMEALTHVPEQVKEQLSEELQSTLEETLSQSLHEHLKDQLQVQLKEQLEGRLSDLLQRQATEQAFILETILDQVQARDDEQKERYESWTQDQTTLWQNQVSVLEEQRQKMDEQREKMNVLSETVSKTTQTIQPLLGLQSMVTAATKGYTWITFLLHFLGTFNVIWLMTRPQRYCQRIRYQLFAVVMTEAVLEIALTGLAQYSNLILSESERVQAIAELRRWALFLECFLYVIGMIVSLATNNNINADGSPEDDEKNASSMTVKSPTNAAVVVEEMQRRQEELVHKLEAAMDRAGRESSIYRPHSRGVANVSANSWTTPRLPAAGSSALSAVRAPSLLDSSARTTDSVSSNHCFYSGAVVSPPNASEPAPYYTHASTGYNHDPSTTSHWNSHNGLPQRYHQPTPYTAPGRWNEEQRRRPVYASSPNNNNHYNIDDYPTIRRQAPCQKNPSSLFVEQQAAATAAAARSTAMLPNVASMEDYFHDALSDPRRDGDDMILSNNNPLPQPDTHTVALETIDRMPTTEPQEHASLSDNRRNSNKRPAEASYSLEGRDEGDDEPPTKRSRSEQD